MEENIHLLGPCEVAVLLYKAVYRCASCDRTGDPSILLPHAFQPHSEETRK